VGPAVRRQWTRRGSPATERRAILPPVIARPHPAGTQGPRRCRRLIGGWTIALSLVVVAGCGGSTAVVRDEAAISASEKQAPTFPRSTALFLAQEDLPAAATLAKSDVVVIDSEWAHRQPRSFFAEIRRLNPTVRLLAYVNIVDRPRSIGSRGYYANRYDLWQFDDRGRSKLPVAWLARTAAGEQLSQYPDTDMTNIMGTVGGRRFSDYAVDWMVRRVWRSGVWDGLFLDVWGDRVYNATRDAWDIDGDGTDEPNSAIFGPGKPWEQAISNAESRLRRQLPKALIVVNGSRTLSGDRLDGRVWESFSDPVKERDPRVDLRDYVTVASAPGHRLPGMQITINRLPQGGPLDQTDYRRARSFLTGTLLQNGYWASAGVDYDEIVAYDEIDGGGRGRGYLGRAIVPSPTWSQVSGPFRGGIGRVSGKLYRRDFTGGIVLHNAGDEAKTVKLEGPYWRLTGRQDPSTNSGEQVTTVTIPPQDGLILVRGRG
jgi:hypothetical protein